MSPAGRLPLSRAEWLAAREFVERVRRAVPAELVQASLFGSKARRAARADSDVDLLLVFRRLSPDREPHATQAERLAERVARETGVPLTAWSVSLPDLRRGRRTPMLVDALEDAIPLWCAGPPLDPVPFTPDDARWCVESLLCRIEEGAEELHRLLGRGDGPGAARRVRDDLVRAGTAILLTRGITRPRRAEVVARLRRALGPSAPPPPLRRVLEWARRSYGPDGRDEERPVGPPPGGLAAAARAVDLLSRDAARRAARLP